MSHIINTDVRVFGASQFCNNSLGTCRIETIEKWGWRDHFVRDNSRIYNLMRRAYFQFSLSLLTNGLFPIKTTKRRINKNKHAPTGKSFCMETKSALDDFIDGALYSCKWQILLYCAIQKCVYTWQVDEQPSMIHCLA